MIILIGRSTPTPGKAVNREARINFRRGVRRVSHFHVTYQAVIRVEAAAGYREKSLRRGFTTEIVSMVERGKSTF